MDSTLLAEARLFWPLVVAGAVASGGFIGLLVALCVTEVACELQQMIHDYTSVHAWTHRHVRKGA